MPVDPNEFPSDPLRRLEAIMAALRGPEGCPWDREQDHRTLRANLLEEAYEVLAVLDRPGDLDDEQFVEELGDLLLQVVFHAQMAAERGAFDLDRVADAVGEKLIRRHPHVFGERSVSGSGEVLRIWEQLKREEGKRSAVNGVPAVLPALLRASRILAKAERAGFLWTSGEEARAKVREELAELEEAGEAGQRMHEMGDLLLALVSYARFLGVEPEAALRQALDRFDRRFRALEDRLEAEGARLPEIDPQKRKRYWSETASAGGAQPEEEGGSDAPGGEEEAAESAEGKSSAS